MKIIFSRKGIDSSFGNFASPIMPDGKLCWMPIPEDSDRKQQLPTYGDISFCGTDLGTIIEDLSSKRIKRNQTVHLDPDIFAMHRARKEDWIPVFGQTGAAESHLRNKKVEVGDIFLYFGWFKQCELIDNTFRYKKAAPDMHVLYGWLQIGNIKRICNIESIPDWLTDHPHMIGCNYGILDTLYFSTNELVIAGKKTGLPGAGYFSAINDGIILTAPGHTRSVWNLPIWMYPSEDKPPLSYNEKREKWIKRDGKIQLKIASRGQEFVLNVDFYPEALDWVEGLIRSEMEKNAH